MPKAVLDGHLIAESDDVRRVEGMTYFPVEAVDFDALERSDTTSRCFWKGRATYWHVTGPAGTARNAAFAYERPWPLARALVKDRVAFWHGVEIVDT